jgi:hypothetical protein
MLRALRAGEAARQDPPPRRGAWVGYVAASVGLFYAHPFGAFTLVSFALAGGWWLWQQRRGLGPFLLAQAAIAVLVLPWTAVPYLQMTRAGSVAGGGGLMGWVEMPPVWAPVRTWVNFVLLGRSFVWWPALAAAVAVGLVALAFAVKRSGSPRPPRTPASAAAGARGFVLIWATLPVVVMLGVSWLWQPIYVDRYVIPAVAGVVALLAAAAASLRDPVASRMAVIACAIAMGSGLIGYYDDPRKGDWPAAAAWLDDHLRPGESLAFFSERGDAAETRHVRDNWFWYGRRGSASTALTLERPDAPADLHRQLRAAAAAAPAEALWLVVWRDPDAAVPLDQRLATRPIDGLILERVEGFFDLTLMRFERSAPGPTSNPGQTRPSLPRGAGKNPAKRQRIS